MKSMTIFIFFTLLVFCIVPSDLFVRSEPTSIDDYEMVIGGESLNLELEGELQKKEEKQMQGENEVMMTGEAVKMVREEEEEKIEMKKADILMETLMKEKLEPEIMGVPPEIGVYSPIPLPLSGKCAAGTTYKINSMIDLYANIENLECIFAAGVEPNDIPLGFSYGYLLSAANTAFWDIPIEIGYQGDYVVKTQCHGKEMYIGWMSILGLDLGTAVWRVGTVDFPLAPGEYPMGKKNGIVMDFGVDFDSLCSVEGNELPLGLKGFSPFQKSPWPVSQFIDIGRVVGRDQSDGGIITLNKAYVTSDQLGAQTFLFYGTKNFDPKIRPDFAKFGGQEISVPLGPKGEKLIEYNKGGLENFVKRIFGSILFDDAFSGILSVLHFGGKRRR